MWVPNLHFFNPLPSYSFLEVLFKKNELPDAWILPSLWLCTCKYNPLGPWELKTLGLEKVWRYYVGTGRCLWSGLSRPVWLVLDMAGHWPRPVSGPQWLSQRLSGRGWASPAWSRHPASALTSPGVNPVIRSKVRYYLSTSGSAMLRLRFKWLG